jgi:S1-C subfamily serine protease
MEPVVARLESEGFHIQRINGSRSPDIAQRFGVDRFPTFIVMSGQREVKREVGAMSYASLRQMMTVAAPPQRSAAPSTFGNAPIRPVSNTTPAPGRPPEIDIPGSRAITPIAPAQPGAPNSDALLSASVRLKVEDATGHSFGTGTIVDAREGEALVLTCAHLFRDSSGNQISDPQSVTAELYQSGDAGLQVVERVPVHRIHSCNFDSDVALVSIRPRGAVRPARIASSSDLLRQGDPVVSVGCSQGADPTIQTGQVTAINRYQGPSNVTASGAPVVGRSGGGLFSLQGEVVGVCNAADYEDDEGIYAALASIHAELDKLGLQAIHGQGATAVAAPAPPAQLRANSQDDGMVPLSTPVVRAQGRNATDSLAALSNSERAAMEEIVQRAADSEVVLIIRPKSAEGRSQVLTLDSVSPAFVRALLAARYEQGSATPGY